MLRDGEAAVAPHPGVRDRGSHTPLRPPPPNPAPPHPTPLGVGSGGAQGPGAGWGGPGGGRAGCARGGMLASNQERAQMAPGAVSFRTEEIRCSIGKSQELAALFALLFILNSLLAIERHHRNR